MSEDLLNVTIEVLKGKIVVFIQKDYLKDNKIQNYDKQVINNLENNVILNQIFKNISNGYAFQGFSYDTRLNTLFSWNKNSDIELTILTKGDKLTLPTGRIHYVTTISKKTSQFIYTFINSSEINNHEVIDHDFCYNDDLSQKCVYNWNEIFFKNWKINFKEDINDKPSLVNIRSYDNNFINFFQQKIQDWSKCFHLLSKALKSITYSL